MSNLLTVFVVLCTTLLGVFQPVRAGADDDRTLSRDTFERTVEVTPYGTFHIQCSLKGSPEADPSESWVWKITWTPQEKRYKSLLQTVFRLLKEHDSVTMNAPRGTGTAEVGPRLSPLTHLFLRIGEYTLSLPMKEMELKGGSPVSATFIGVLDADEYGDVHPSVVLKEWKGQSQEISLFIAEARWTLITLSRTMDNDRYESMDGFRTAFQSHRLLYDLVPPKIGEEGGLYVEVRPHSSEWSTNYQAKVAVLPNGIVGLNTIKNLKTSRSITIRFMDEEGFVLNSYTIHPNYWTSVVVTDKHTRRSYTMALRHDIRFIALNGKPARIKVVESYD